MSDIHELEKQLQTFEFRPSASVNIIEGGGSPWTAFRRNPKVLREDVADVIERAFDCGGFVAGGCARWLLSFEGTEVTPLHRGTYVHEGGDVDLFFRTDDGWRSFVEPYIENKTVDEGPVLSISQGNLAVNVRFGVKTRIENTRGKPLIHGWNEPPTVQAVRCVTGTPEEVLRSFDFLNSMVAFDRNKVWQADDWKRLENDKTLAVAWWGSRSAVFRVRKYMSKYGYKQLVNTSTAMFDQLIQATNSMDDRRKDISRKLWIEILSRPICALDLKLTILASTAEGIETRDIFDLAKNKPNNVLWHGAYEQAISHLLARQEAARGRPRRHAYDDPMDFDANEYCWAV